MDHQSREQWNQLLRKQAKEYKEKASELGGVMIKVGQFLGARTDIIPEVVVQELLSLVDHVPPSTHRYAVDLLEKEWNCTWQEQLLQMDEEPIASASIGDVYRAVLQDGSQVAIKIQRNRIVDIFHMDFKALKVVFWLFKTWTAIGKKADMRKLYNELIYVMDRELDFKQELEFGTYFKQRYEKNQQLHIPDYYASLCTDKVLVMEWVEGVKITDTAFMDRHHIDRRKIARLLFDFYFDQYLKEGYFHADPHAGNIMIHASGVISIIDFGMVGAISKRDVNQFKQLIQGLIVDDYTLVIQALEDMHFILPGANTVQLKKMIKQTFDLYETAEQSKMDAHMMNQIKDDVLQFIHEQPIQMSAEYAYLSRAISIIFGILITLDPSLDLGAWTKPKIRKWLGNRRLAEAFYQQKLKEVTAPIQSFAEAAMNWLERGDKDREWEKEKLRRQQRHQLFMFMEILCFSLAITGVGLLYVKIVSVWIGSLIIAGFSTGGLITLIQHMKGINKES